MNTQDRAVVKALLQSMTNSCLFHTDEFRAALKHFNITTTYSGQQVSDEAATLLGKEKNHFVDVFYPDNVDTEPYGVRFWFDSKAEAEAYAARERLNGDEPVNQRVLDARKIHFATLARNIEIAHGEALEMDAEFNFERVSREINQSRNETARAIIARALHVGANSFGHVIGEHEELVETLRNADYPEAADKVDAVMDTIGGDNHKVIRRNWLEALRKVSSTL